MMWIFLLAPDDSIPKFEQMLVNSYILSTHKGHYRWKMEADTIYDYGKTYMVYGLKLLFFEGDRVSSTIVADSGLMDRNTRNMKAMGNVLVVTYDSISLSTNLLMWDERRDRIFTDDTVEIVQGDRLLRGIGFESDPSLQHIVIRRQVYGEGRERISR